MAGAKADGREAADAGAGAASKAAFVQGRSPGRGPTPSTHQPKSNRTNKRKEFIMPGGDRTGPMGQGPMTGWGAGYCGGSGQPGWLSQRQGRWAGRGQGAGRGGGGGWRGGGGGWGFRHWFHATGLTGWQRAAANRPAWGGAGAAPAGTADLPGASPDQELAWLKQQASQLETGLEQIRKRIAELDPG